MAQPEVQKKLQAEGWNLKTEALDALVQEFADDHQPDASNSASAAGPTYSELRAALLDCDLRKYGAGSLPEDVNRANSSHIKGPMVLQVMSVSDISKPSYATSGSSRLLALKLHDGRIACKAVETQHCNHISDTLLPGSKVALAAAAVRCGVVLLEPRSLRILGGRVDSLAEAWITQKRYGGTNRPGLAAASGSAAGADVGPAGPGEAAGARLAAGAAASSAITPDDGASAPRFRQFVPGKDGKRTQQQASTAEPAAKGGSSSSSRGTAMKGPAAAAGTSAVAAALAATPGSKADSTAAAKAPVKRSVDVAPARLIDAATAKQQSAAQAKLLDKLERSQAEATDRRGKGRGRRGRRRGDGSDDDDGGGGMTLEEYEAQRRSLTAGGVLAAARPGGATSGVVPQHGDPEKAEQMRRDEEMARQLQAQLDLEEAGYAAEQQQQQGCGGRRNGSGARFGALGRGIGCMPVGQHDNRAEQQQQRRGNHGGSGVDYTRAMFDQFDYGHGGGRGQQQQQYGRGGGAGHSTGGYSGRGGGRGRGDAEGRGGRGQPPGGRGRGRGRGPYCF